MVSHKNQKQHASNYNYKVKRKRSFKQKLKNFFTIPEEDLKEEPTKQFEKIKLFTLTRGSLFLGILIFMMLINILVGFNMNFLYFRQILGFLFLILVPGLLIMLCFKIRTVKFWEYLVYTVGLSVSFIMFAGLAVNWTLPALGITDKPLSLWPILICFNIFLLALWSTAVYRNRDLRPLDITIPKLDSINRIFFIIPIFFPLLSILGAFLLNNHGPNILTMIMLGGIAVYVLLLVIFRKRMNENIWPWAILMMSLALLLQFSLRSWFISGWDISQEMYVFRLTQDSQIWLLKNYNDAYNTCLSLSILPTIINIFLKVNINLVFKLFFQIIFIFHSLTIYLIFKRYTSKITSFIASFLYFSAGYYNSAFPTLIRQEIAFMFFGLMILILFLKDINPILKRTLFFIFGISMVVGHYSTTYVALAMFTLTYLCSLIYKAHENQKVKKGKLHPSQKSEFYLTGILILLLFLFGFFWLYQITDTSDGIISTIKTTYQNIGEVFSDDLKHSSVMGALFGSSRVEVYDTVKLNDYIDEIKPSFEILNPYSTQQMQIYSPQIVSRDFIRPKNTNLIIPLLYIYQFIKYAIILSFIGGLLFIYLNKKSGINKEFFLMIFFFVFFMFLIILLPHISRAYNFERLFQQCLIFLSFSSIVFFQKIMRNSKNTFVLFTVLIYIGYSLFNLGFLLAYSGGNPSLNLYNSGSTYNTLYSHNGEVISIDWIVKSTPRDIIYLDSYSELKFYSFGNPTLPHDKKIIPFFMDRDSYVYSSYSNKVKMANYWDARERFNNGVLFFNFPTEFMEDNKYKIYNNGGSEIFE